MDKIYSDLEKNIAWLKAEFSGSADLMIRNFTLGNTAKTKAAVVIIDSMCDKQNISDQIIRPLTWGSFEEEKAPAELYKQAVNLLSTPDLIEFEKHSELMSYLLSGFAILMLDGFEKMSAIGVQSFSFRGISEPSGETVQRGSREGFSEPLRVNMSLVRRRIKSPDLMFEIMTVGNLSKTQICLCYVKSVSDPAMVLDLKERLKKIELQTTFAAGYLVSYLEGKNDKSLYSEIGVSERPDTVCGKLSEGRIGIIVDGTPAVLLVPHLFIENFQTIDDYSNRSYFATFTRILKYTAFLISLYLPALYVALSYFHPEYFPTQLLPKVVDAVYQTPLPLVFEVMMIFFIYEIMREAGLRIPRPTGHVVGIVGALVIGDAAVSAGIIGAPTLMVVAISSICGYVVPNLQASLTVQRLILIIAAATLGIFGITAVSVLIMINMCAKESMGVPFMAPIAPFDKLSMRDVFIRQDWSEMGKVQTFIKNNRLVHSGKE